MKAATAMGVTEEEACQESTGMQNPASPHSVINVANDNHINGGSSFSHPQVRFFEFIRPLNLESHINNAVHEPHSVGDQVLPKNVPLINDHHHQVCYKELLRKKGVEIAGALVSTLFLLFTLTVKSLKEIKPRFKIAGMLLILPLWSFALGFLIFVFGRFICVCIVGGAVFLLCYQVPHTVYIILHSNQTATGTYFWGVLVYIFLEQLILPADSHIGHIPMGHRQLVTSAFTLFTICQGGKILFRTVRIMIYLKFFNKKMKDVLFRLFMFEALLGPPLTDERRTELADEANGRSKKSSRTTTVEYSTSKLLMHDEGRILLANIDGFIELQFVRSQEDIWQQASRAFEHIITNNGEHKYIDVSRFLTSQEKAMAEEAELMPAGFGRGKINQSTFLEWAVEAYRRHKSLVYAIIDTKRMLCYLQYPLITSTFVTVIVALHAQEKIMIYFASVLILGHISVHTFRTIFNSIFFVFVAHPFDVGDCCVIDGYKMIVEEINIVYTVFLRFDTKVKVSHPNCQLLSKPISNYSKNPDMSERIEFSIGTGTIDQLRTRVKGHLRSKPEHWQWREHDYLLMQGIEEGKMKMTLNVQHNMNYLNIPEMDRRKEQLLTDLVKICQDLNIRNLVIPPLD